MDNNTILKIDNLYAGYFKGKHILNGLNLEIHNNEIVAIVGVNGSGKSTIAKAIMNIVPFRAGSIMFNQKEVLDRKLLTHDMLKMGIGYFMQEGAVFKNLSIEENLLFAGRNLDKKSLKLSLACNESRFDLLKNNKWSQNASSLSGGEKHQLALAMIMMQQPKLLILDEPSAGLSLENMKALFDLIIEIKQEKQISVLLIEQKEFEAHAIADRMALLRLGSIAKFEETKKIENIKQFFWD